jgi:hypothetical protein
MFKRLICVFMLAGGVGLMPTPASAQMTVFGNVVPLSRTNPEAIESIRAWGRERAVPASGQPAVVPDQTRARRAVLV